jgi:outer membrane protein assembly factor BamE (lipoprotein component of BamABCDE complex)
MKKLRGHLRQFSLFYHSRNTGRTFAVALILLGLATACAPVSRLSWREPTVLEKSGYDFIRDGVSTREDLLARLGTPSYKFENKRVLIYRFQQEDNRIFLLSDRQGQPVRNVKYEKDPDQNLGHVVLIFAQNGVLEKHSLVIPKGIPGFRQSHEHTL